MPQLVLTQSWFNSFFGSGWLRFPNICFFLFFKQEKSSNTTMSNVFRMRACQSTKILVKGGSLLFSFRYGESFRSDKTLKVNPFVSMWNKSNFSFRWSSQKNTGSQNISCSSWKGYFLPERMWWSLMTWKRWTSVRWNRGHIRNNTAGKFMRKMTKAPEGCNVRHSNYREPSLCTTCMVFVQFLESVKKWRRFDPCL